MESSAWCQRLTAGVARCSRARLPTSAKLIAGDTDKWAKVIRAANITAE
jgi:hypothetical protein